MLPTGFRTFHFVSFLYVFFFSFLFLLFLFSLLCFRFFLRFVSFRYFSLCFLFGFFLSVSFRFFSFFSVSQFTGTQLGMHEVLMVPYKCCCFSARSAQGRIQGGAKIGHRGHLLQETSSSDQKATATNQMHSNDQEACGEKCCYFWFHF